MSTLVEKTMGRPDTETNEVRTAVIEAMKSSPYRTMRELEVAVTAERRIRIRGAVYSFYHKQLAQEMFRKIAEAYGYAIANHVNVVEEVLASADE